MLSTSVTFLPGQPFRLCSHPLQNRLERGFGGLCLRLQRLQFLEFLVVLNELECLGTRADLLGNAVQLVIKNIAEALGEDERGGLNGFRLSRTLDQKRRNYFFRLGTRTEDGH